MLSLRLTTPARHCAVALAAAALLTGLLSASAVPVSTTGKGEQVFRQRCASCHGAKGEGAKGHPKPLFGTRSAGQLAEFIAKSMPPAPAKKLARKDAQSVAAYIHDAFYSPVAQARNRPARVELSRLTVRQYRNAAADLVDSFRPAGAWSDQRGLRGRYYKGRLRGGEALLNRVDPQVRFDFGQAAPAPEIDDPYQFSIRWEGGVLAPETGEYEFIVRTEQATRLWINDLLEPAIDAYVKSGNDTEYRASIFLVGGRVYPLRLDFMKAQQGVNNQERLRAKPPEPASIVLEWKPPRQAAQAVPQHNLLPATFPEVFVVGTPFPPDDRSVGYERGTSVSKAWEEATTEAAIETANYVTAHLGELAGVPGDEPRSAEFGRRRRSEAAEPPAAPISPEEREKRVREFCRRFVERAFRRPLSPELERVYVARHFQGAQDTEAAVKRIVLLALKSPRFLYRELGEASAGGPEPYDVASRLSFGMWDSLPDAELLKAAAAGELSTREQVVRQAERMLPDPRTRSKLRDFFFQWLNIEQHPELAKDPKQFPGFDPSAASDLRTSLELSLEHGIWSEKSDFRELLLGDRLFLNGRLAKLYGVDLPAGAPFQLVSLDAGERAGLLTHPYLMASFAYLDGSSPIHRGVLLARNILGRSLQPPPEAFEPLPAALHPRLTTRQRVALQTRPAACVSCHGMINPLGFTLEKFDAIGRLRAQENGLPIDATGGYQSRTGKEARFSGARDLAAFLAGSEEAHAAFVERLFQHLVKQPVQAYGPRTLPDLQKALTANGFSIRKQVVETLAATALGQAAPRGLPGADR